MMPPRRRWWPTRQAQADPSHAVAPAAPPAAATANGTRPHRHGAQPYALVPPTLESHP
jgi:hypothetical protein